MDIAGETSVAFETTSGIQQELERFLTAHIYPKPVEIEYRWSGIMGFTNDKLPLIKHLSGRITAFVSCNGMGVALAPVIAEGIEL